MDKHNCTVPQSDEKLSDGYGPAIDTCAENDKGELWVDNDEYGSRVNYCPYCGYKAIN